MRKIVQIIIFVFVVLLVGGLLVISLMPQRVPANNVLGLNNYGISAGDTMPVPAGSSIEGNVTEYRVTVKDVMIVLDENRSGWVGYDPTADILSIPGANQTVHKTVIGGEFGSAGTIAGQNNTTWYVASYLAHPDVKCRIYSGNLTSFQYVAQKMRVTIGQ